MIGYDSSILVFAMDPLTSEHQKAVESFGSLDGWAINPTVVHEVYHALVYKRRLAPIDAEAKVRRLVRDRRTAFFNLTKQVSLYSVSLAAKYKLGGRDSVIAGCYMLNGVGSILTHDQSLLRLERLKFRGREIGFQDPLA